MNWESEDWDFYDDDELFDDEGNLRAEIAREIKGNSGSGSVARPGVLDEMVPPAMFVGVVLLLIMLVAAAC